MTTSLCDAVVAETGPATAAWLAQAHPDLQAVYAYWDAQRGSRRMPARGDIDPADLVPYLPSLMLVDVQAEPRSYIYRLVGTREVVVRGGDPTGKSVDTHAFGLATQYALHNYDCVVETRAPWVDRFEMLSVDARIVDRDKLFLPLSNDDDTVNMVMVFSVHQDIDSKAA